MPEVEPTNDELLDMVTLGKACDWAELPHREASPGSDVAPPSPRGSLLSLLGAKESMHPRVIGGIQPDEFKDYVKEWKVGGVTPSPVLRSCAGLLGTACRLACGVQKRRADIVTEAHDYKEKQLKELELQTLLAQAQGPGSAAHHPAGSKRIKLATIVDQQNDAEADELSEMDVAAAYQRYRTSQGADPRPEEDLTKDQLAGLSCLYKSGSPPYVDLAVWGPYGRRLQKRLKMTGLIMGANGKLEQQQLYGPPNVDEWVAGWTVFKTGSIMLGHMTPATCDHWSKMVLNYAKMYGPSVWPLIYQSEVRARLEHMDRVRRIGALEADEAVAQGKTHGYDAKCPWDWALRKTADDVLWWRRELEDVAMLVKVEISSLRESLGVDAMVCGSSSSQVTSRTSLPPPALPPPARDHPPAKRQRIANVNKHHSTDTEGNLVSNRRGTPLCQGFQTGACPYNRGTVRCPKNRDQAHQCARCLAPAHGSKWPRDCHNDIANAPPVKDGKGKGKSKKGNKPPF